MFAIPDAALVEFVAETEEMLEALSNNFSKIEKGDYSKELKQTVGGHIARSAANTLAVF